MIDMEYLESTLETSIWHFDLLEVAWHQPQTSIMSLIQLSCVVLWTKNASCTVQN